MNISKSFKTTKMKRLLQQLMLTTIFLLGIFFDANAQCDNDTQKPSAVCHDKLDFTIDNAGQFILTPDLINAGSFDNCTVEENLSYRIELGENYTGNVPTTSTLIFSNPANHTIFLWVIDEAGNVNACFSEVNIFAANQDCANDTAAPVVTCLNGLRFFKGSELFGRDAIDEVRDNCASIDELRYTLQLAEDFTGTVPNTQFLTFDEAGIFNAYFWVTDLNGNSSYCNSNLIVDDVFNLEGTVFLDANEDCIRNGGEAAASTSLKVSLIEADVTTYSIIAKSENGIYSEQLPKPKTTNARVEVSFVQAGLQSCQAIYTTDLANADLAETIVVAPIGLQLTQGCADLSVNVQATDVSCNVEGAYLVNYNNTGSEVTDPIITLKFSNKVKLISVHADHTYETILTTDGDTDTYTFKVQQLLPGASGYFFIIGQQICAYANQTEIIYASINADNACSNLYDGPSMQVTKDCIGDEVEFTVQNVGSKDMLSPANFVIIEDVIMRNQGTFELAAGESEVFRAPANGATYHFQAAQVPDFPWQAITTVALEGCSTNPATISTGKVAQISLENSAKHLDVEVVENKLVVFNRLQALPIGKGTEHLIEKNTPIEYKLNYSNTSGTGVAKEMLLEFVVSEFLDINSLEIVFATHPEFVMTKKEGNVLEFAFPNIFLLDNAINQTAASGLLTFKLNQKPNVASTTIIKNELSVQFDDKASVNSTIYHTIGELADEFSTSVANVLGQNIGLSVYPNPFSQSAFFEIDLVDKTGTYLELYNANGQLIQTNKISTNSFRLLRNGLETGLYFYVLKQHGQAVNTGKLFVE